MKRRQWAWPILLAGMLAGCASDPTLIPKLEQSLQTVQAYYEPMLKQWGANDAKVQMAVVAADTTLKMLGDLQKQRHPDPKAVEQAQLQTAQAVKLAQQAGVKEAGAPATSPMPSEASASAKTAPEAASNSATPVPAPPAGPAPAGK